MAKSNLTDTQKSILKRLTDEFTQLNAVAPEPQGLIDVAGIMEQTRLEKLTTAEVTPDLAYDIIKTNIQNNNVTVNTQATDAKGIARELPKALDDNAARMLGMGGSN